jgi:hypothetical protein
LEVLKTACSGFEDIKMLTKFPNLRNLVGDFSPDLDLCGLKPEDTMNLSKVLKSWNWVPSIFIHLEELHARFFSSSPLPDLVHHQLPRLTKLKRMRLVISFTKFSVSDSILLKDMCRNLPGSLTTVESLRIMEYDVKHSLIHVKEVKGELLSSSSCILEIDYDVEIIRARPQPN